ncbi:UNVERIFIED_CONTAM: hypothetical protein GTU68_046354, partial [Idotea baltica]|nr:hypothetical protein [Idotea baltica]
MIAYLSGKIVSIEKDKIIISAGGVGYEANCTQKTSDKFFDKTECELFIKTVVKEDDISLYGFQTLEDKRWFEIVTDVQGVGPRMGLSILNTYDHNSLLEIIMSED